MSRVNKPRDRLDGESSSSVISVVASSPDDQIMRMRERREGNGRERGSDHRRTDRSGRGRGLMTTSTKGSSRARLI